MGNIIRFAILLALSLGGTTIASQRTRMEAREAISGISFNNDGGDAYLYRRKCLPFSIQKFLDLRTTQLLKTPIRTISYCTISSSFGQFTHRTEKGEMLLNSHKRPGYVNVTPEFFRLETDPLKEQIRFAHDHGMTLFWCFRMNDTHDACHRPHKPYERYSRLKQAHPEYMMGKIGQRLPHGRWSAMDFSRPEIRRLAADFVREVCSAYDVDGVELDFFRHLYLFPSVARGGRASAGELKMLTDMLGEIRRILDDTERQRKRPVLLAVRIPDSLPYCKAVGIDLETWLRNGWLDLVIGSGYFRLNPWEDMRALAHEHGAKYYACLSESRVRNEHPRMKRNSPQALRARVAVARQAKVDGIQLFNAFDLSRPCYDFLRDITKDNLKTTWGLERKDKLYFLTDLDTSPKAYLRRGETFQNLPLVSPQHPLNLPATTELWIGEEQKDCQARLMAYGNNLKDVTLTFNRHALAHPEIIDGELLAWNVPASLLRPGKNVITASCNTPAMLKDMALHITYGKGTKPCETAKH